MTRDDIVEIGIDAAGSLYVRPGTATFPMIYREAMEVGWDRDRQQLFGPKPREWTYVDWFKQIYDAARAQGVALQITSQTTWSNIPVDLRQAIETARPAE